MLWNFIETFGRQFLRLSPFSVEDFGQALNYHQELNLIAEVHICLLKYLKNRTITTRNWSDALRTFLSGEGFCSYVSESDFSKNTLGDLRNKGYYKLSVEQKIIILRFLVDKILDTEEVREHLEEALEIRIELEREKREQDIEEKRKEREEHESASSSLSYSNLQLEKEREKSTAIPQTQTQQQTSSIHLDELHMKKQKRDETFQKKLSRHQVRGIPLGYDRFFNRFWLFDGTNLETIFAFAPSFLFL